MANVEDELTLEEVCDGFVRNKKSVFRIITCGFFLGVLLSVILSIYGGVNKTYSASASILINSKDSLQSYSNGQESPSLNDISLAKSLVDTARFLVKSEKMYLKLAERLNFNISYAAYQESITLSQVEETQILILNVTSTSRTESVLIVNEIVKILPAQLQETMDIGNVSVIDLPVSAKQVTGFSPVFLILSGLIIGAIGAAAWTIIQTITHPVISRPSNIHKALGIDIVAEVPRQRLGEKEEFLRVTRGSASLPFIKNFGPLAAVFRASSVSKTLKCVLVTSTLGGEGKSTIALNLAFAMLLDGRRVLLIDCDTKRPTLGKILKTGHHTLQTLNRVLKREISLRESIIKTPLGLDFVQSLPEADLFITSDLNAQIRQLYDEYEYIFLDTPPVGICSDALSLFECVDSAVFVIRQAFAETGLLREAADNLKKAKIPVVSAVLNQVQKRKRRRGGYQRDYKQPCGYSGTKTGGAASANNPRQAGKDGDAADLHITPKR